MCVVTQFHNPREIPFEESFNSIQEEMKSLDITTDPIAPLGMSYLPVILDESFQAYSGISHTREAIVEFLWENEILRPFHNIKRKKRELEATSEMTILFSSGFECNHEFVSPF